MPKNYVVPNVIDDLQNRLQNITQQILSRTRLLLIIDKLHLYSNGHRKLTQDEKVELMRNDIDIELVRDTQNEITAFRIYYSAHDPHVAQQVTSELTNLFISENLKVRQQQSEDTTKFIGSSWRMRVRVWPRRKPRFESSRDDTKANCLPGSEQPTNSQWTSSTTTERTRYSQRGETAANLSSDIDRAVQGCPYDFPVCRWNTNRFSSA